MTDDEQWLPVVGWEGQYEVSTQGRIRSLARTCGHRSGIRRVPEKILTPSPNNHGTMSVRLGNGTKTGTMRRVCEIVLEAFVGPRPAGMDICHWNDDPSDNRLTNLRYDTRAANQDDAVRNGKNPRANQTHCIHGHEFNSANTRVIIRKESGRPRRICKTCVNNRCREHYHQRRAAS